MNDKKYCDDCGGEKIKLEVEYEYSDVASESNTSNHLVSIKNFICLDCGSDAIYEKNYINTYEY